MTNIISLPLNKTRELLEFCQTNNVDQFFFAKDQGAYFGATAGKGDTFCNSIHYMRGCDPDKNPDFYENAMARFGGDDFGEHFPVKWLELSLNNGHGVKIKMTAKQCALLMQTVKPVQ